MDSLSQLVLGSAIGVAVMGKRTAVWKAALWGGVAGTLPDLDALVDFGDAVSNMVQHRAQTHGLFYLSLLSPLIARGVSRLHKQPEHFKRWWLALWLALFTHPVLDYFTVYGTQLLQPFSSYPFGLGSMFIVDPLYTLPLLVGLLVALFTKRPTGLRWNALALAFSCLYLGWSVVAQQMVKSVVQENLAARGMENARFLVTPAPLNTVLWRVVVMRANGYEEGFYSLLDSDRRIHWDKFSSDDALRQTLKGNPHVERLAAFTHGFFKLEQQGDKAVLTDLRMGQEPAYVFSFVVSQQKAPEPGATAHWETITPEAAGSRGDASRQLAWLWPRMLGQALPPPR
jgi:inner membrane protein